MTSAEERQMLRDTVAALVDKHASPAAVRAAMESARGYDESLWSMLCEQVGVAALVVPEEFGGAGGELADAAVGSRGTRPRSGAHSAARHDAGRAGAAGRRRTRRRGPRAAGRRRGDRRGGLRSRLRGQRRHRRRRRRRRRRPAGALDRRHRRSRSPPSTRPAGWRGSRAGATEPIGTDPGLADTAAILLAAEQVGAAARCLELTVAYTKERVQFGRPIGSFQALKHRMADLYVAVQSARAVVDDAIAEPTRRPRRRWPGWPPARPSRTVAGEAIQTARRYRDHLGARHPAVLQTGARQRAAVRSAERPTAQARIRSVLAWVR